VYGVSVGGGGNATIPADGQTHQVFIIPITNTGDQVDNIVVTLSDDAPAGWQTQLCFDDFCYVNDVADDRWWDPGTTQEAQIRVSAPSGTPPGTQVSLTLNAISQGDTSKTGTAHMTVTVE